MNNYIDDIKQKISPIDEASKSKTLSNWDRIAKPLGSLGKLEKLVVKLSGIYGKSKLSRTDIEKKCVLVVCADNGVVCENISQSDSSVTASVVYDICEGKSNINIMAKAAGADTYAVDMGILGNVAHDRLIDGRVMDGTGNIAVGPAMSYEQAVQAIENGINLVKDAYDNGYRLVVTGEMGIGNTTTSSAIASVLLGREVSEVTGRGAGLSSEGLERKVRIIEKAIEVNDAKMSDSIIELIAKLGGLDIAAMVGIYLGGAIYRVPVLIDGFISSIAALCAYRIDKRVAEYMIETHVSGEPAAIMIMEEMGLDPIIHANMSLGEGTGAVCLIPMIEIALEEYSSAHRFADTDIEQYKELK